MSGVLVSTGWRWARVGGSQVLHLVPPQPLHGSRTACGRLSVWDATLETPAGLLDEVRRCSACSAYGAKGRA
jgi:hypothetical protein